MAIKRVLDLDADTVIKFGSRGENALPKGSKFEGYYIGSKTVQSKLGPSTLHVFQTPQGNVGIWGSAQLNIKLSGLNGFMTYIKFVKETPVPKGTMKVFDVQYDDENTIEVEGVTVNFNANTGADESTEEEYADEEIETAEELAVEEEQAPPPAKAASASKAPVSRPSVSAASSAKQRATVNQLLGKR